MLPGVAFGLGAWQVYRWDWKQQQLALRSSRASAPPERWPPPSLAPELEFRRVVARGRFDHAAEARVGPRSEGGKTGELVVTPLELEGGLGRVLVNRGWAPTGETEGLLRPEGLVEVLGAVRTSEKRGRFTPPNDPANGRYFWFDHAALNAALRCDLDVRLDALRGDERAPPFGSGNHLWSMPNNHATYVATWWSLGLLLTYVWARARRRHR